MSGVVIGNPFRFRRDVSDLTTIAVHLDIGTLLFPPSLQDEFGMGRHSRHVVPG
jgi:hypothetical protein